MRRPYPHPMEPYDYRAPRAGMLARIVNGIAWLLVLGLTIAVLAAVVPDLLVSYGLVSPETMSTVLHMATPATTIRALPTAAPLPPAVVIPAAPPAVVAPIAPAVPAAPAPQAVPTRTPVAALEPAGDPSYATGGPPSDPDTATSPGLDWQAHAIPRQGGIAVCVFAYKVKRMACFPAGVMPTTDQQQSMANDLLSGALPGDPIQSFGEVRDATGTL